jgi:very-short-patch-repair endonuclease
MRSEKATLNHARRMRAAPTSDEAKLWGSLRRRALGDLKFRRQAPIGPYVVDFVCLEKRLIVEADGPFHDADRDGARDAWLTRQGFRVLRFPNGMVAADHKAVLAAILRAAQSRG